MKFVVCTKHNANELFKSTTKERQIFQHKNCITNIFYQKIEDTLICVFQGLKMKRIFIIPSALEFKEQEIGA